MSSLRRVLIVFAAVLLFGTTAVGAQVPESIDGELVVVPVVASDAISLDGDLGDWALLPAIITTGGPQPSDDPATRGELRWQLAATDDVLFVAATITDDLIVAGQNGTQFWREDSIEVYLNFGDLDATEYGDRVGQITISPIDRGNTDPELLTTTGLGSENFTTSGLVFDTSDGWGFEIAIELAGLADASAASEFGVQMQANGSSGGERNLKLSWSNADSDDTSFQDPSVFGRGAFLFDQNADADAEAVEENPVESSEPSNVLVEEPQPETEIVTEGADEIRPDTEPEPGRTLLVAAVFSAVSILLGGLWFERRRKQSEAKLAAVSAREAEHDDREVDDATFGEMIDSILDED